MIYSVLKLPSLNRTHPTASAQRCRTYNGVFWEPIICTGSAADRRVDPLWTAVVSEARERYNRDWNPFEHNQESAILKKKCTLALVTKELPKIPNIMTQQHLPISKFARGGF
jgi:hypothetical protein